MFVGMTLVCWIGMELCMFGLMTADGFPMALSWVHLFCSVREPENVGKHMMLSKHRR